MSNSWVLNGMSGIVVTGELNYLLFLFTRLTLQKASFLFPRDLIVPPAGNKNQESVSYKPFAPLDTRRQMAKWACLCVVLHSFVNSLLSLNEVLAALRLLKVWRQQGSLCGFAFSKADFCLAEKTKSLFVHFVSLATAMNLSWMSCLNDPQLVKVPLGGTRSFFLGDFFFGGEGWVLLALFCLWAIPEDCQQLKDFIPSQGMKWQSKPL